MGSLDIAAIIPVFNDLPGLWRAVESVASQSVRPDELIIVDDGSTLHDNATLSGLCEAFSALAPRVIRLPCNGGPANARNVGWSAASSSLIAFLDSDEVWHPRKLEVQQRVMSGHSWLAGCGHRTEVLEVIDLKSSPQPHTEDPPLRRVTARQQLVRNRFTTPSMMLRRSVPLRFAEGMRYSEDYDLWTRLLLEGHSLVVIEETLGYRDRAPFSGAGLSSNLWRMEQGELTVYRGLAKSGLISSGVAYAYQCWSLTRFLRRVAQRSRRQLMRSFAKSRTRPRI